MLIVRKLTSSGRRVRKLAALAIGLGLAQLVACSDDDPPATSTGQACSAAEQCFPGVTKEELLGEAVCLDRVEGGYCTHLCTQDSDCCAVAGECAGNHAEVCAPFESTDDQYCFLSCEEDDYASTAITDADAYCEAYAGAAFHCRSTGGGSKNRKVCMP
jgi:hypothetical protein